jgi:hypothetical protein
MTVLGGEVRFETETLPRDVSYRPVHKGSQQRGQRASFLSCWADLSLPLNCLGAFLLDHIDREICFSGGLVLRSIEIREHRTPSLLPWSLANRLRLPR